MTAAQARRVRELRSRVLVRAFEYRQRRHARGAWFRLRRALALSSEAFAISRDDAQQLIAEGHAPESVGLELEPQRTILFVSRERATRLASARAITVGLTAEMLNAEHLALVAFQPGAPSR